MWFSRGRLKKNPAQSHIRIVPDFKEKFRLCIEKRNVFICAKRRVMQIAMRECRNRFADAPNGAASDADILPA